MKFKLDRVCCLSLSKGCFLLGLLDLAAIIYLIATTLKLALDTPSMNNKLLLVIAVIGACTCLFMLSGSILVITNLLGIIRALKDNHWSMLPHLAWEMVLIIIYIAIGLILLCQRLENNTIDTVMIVLILSCAPTLGIYYWIVMHSRYLEIKKKQSAPSDLVAPE